MRSPTLCLAAALALCLALPYCNAKPLVGEVLKAAPCGCGSVVPKVPVPCGCGGVVPKIPAPCGCGGVVPKIPAVGPVNPKIPACGCIPKVPAPGAVVPKIPGVNVVPNVPAVGKIVPNVPAVGKIVPNVPAVGAIVPKIPTPCGCGGIVPKSVVPCGCGALLSEAEIKQKYARLQSESLDAWFQRITSRSYEWTSSPDSYLKTLSIVWKDFSDLELWYSPKYVKYVKDFYTLYFARKDNEEWGTYYARLVQKQAWESEELYARRITVLRDCFPDYDLWTNPIWFEKYTKNLYALEFKKFASESEVDYINRIFKRDEFFDISDEVWAKRIFLIQEATLNSCSLWYNEKYLSYFKNFYSIWYKKKEGESPDAWLVRALTPLPGESFDLALKRVQLIKQVTGEWGYWSLDYFKQVQSLKCFQSDWLLKVQNSIFSCGCGGASYVKTASRKNSASASASGSEESSTLKVVS